MIGIFIIAGLAIVCWLTAEARNAQPLVRLTAGMAAVLLSVIAGYGWCRAAVQFRIEAPNRLLETLSSADEQGRQTDVSAALRVYRSQMRNNPVNAAVAATDALQAAKKTRQR
jgi:cytoskeletal protein RodZ